MTRREIYIQSSTSQAGNRLLHVDSESQPDLLLNFIDTRRSEGASNFVTTSLSISHIDPSKSTQSAAWNVASAHHQQQITNKTTKMVHRSEFLRNFHLKVTTEFHRDGQEAQWAPSTSGPRFWGDENEIIELDGSDTTGPGRFRSAMAVSSDGRSLAVASSSVIRVFDVGTRELRGELKGHAGSVGKLVFAPLGGRDEGSCYTLLSVCQDDYGRGKVVVVWNLDGEGCQIVATPFRPFGIEI